MRPSACKCVVRGAWCVQVRGAWCVLVRGAWCVQVRGAWCVVRVCAPPHLDDVWCPCRVLAGHEGEGLAQQPGPACAPDPAHTRKQPCHQQSAHSSQAAATAASAPHPLHGRSGGILVVVAKYECQLISKPAN